MNRQLPIVLLCFFFSSILIAQQKYAVEVAAFAEPVSKGYFGELKGVYETLDVNYIYRYYIDASDQAAANQTLSAVKEAGFVNAKVVDFEQLKQQCQDACAYMPPKRTGKRIENPNLNKRETYVDVSNLYPIFFDFDKYYLRKESIDELDKYVAVLSRNPDYTIKIYAHTDAKGDDAYNIRLSKNRANSAKNYLIKNGIKRSRINIATFGEKKPVAKNQDEQGHDLADGRQLNRRIEFEVYDAAGQVLGIVEGVRVPSYLKEQ